MYEAICYRLVDYAIPVVQITPSHIHVERIDEEPAVFWNGKPPPAKPRVPSSKRKPRPGAATGSRGHRVRCRSNVLSLQRACVSTFMRFKVD